MDNFKIALFIGHKILDIRISYYYTLFIEYNLMADGQVAFLFYSTTVELENGFSTKRANHQTYQEKTKIVLLIFEKNFTKKPN